MTFRLHTKGKKRKTVVIRILQPQVIINYIHNKISFIKSQI